jgi:hypothetical protein
MPATEASSHLSIRASMQTNLCPVDYLEIVAGSARRFSA